MTSVEPLVERLYSLEELKERAIHFAMRRHFLRETTAISTGRSPSCFARFSEQEWLRTHTLERAILSID
jgi:hypothetical protein